MKYTGKAGFWLYPSGMSYGGVNVVIHGVEGISITQEAHEVLRKNGQDESDNAGCYSNAGGAKLYTEMKAKQEAEAKAKAEMEAEAAKKIMIPKTEKSAKKTK